MMLWNRMIWCYEIAWYDVMKSHDMMLWNRMIWCYEIAWYDVMKSHDMMLWNRMIWCYEIAWYDVMKSHDMMLRNRMIWCYWNRMIWCYEIAWWCYEIAWYDMMFVNSMCCLSKYTLVVCFSDHSRHLHKNLKKYINVSGFEVTTFSCGGFRIIIPIGTSCNFSEYDPRLRY